MMATDDDSTDSTRAPIDDPFDEGAHLRRLALEMTPAERFDWLCTTVEEMLPLVGTARPRRQQAEEQPLDVDEDQTSSEPR